MKKVYLLIILVIAIFTITQSCSVQKRVYLSGYHINWKNHNNSIESKQISQDQDIATIDNNIPLGETNGIEKQSIEIIKEVPAEEIKSELSPKRAIRFNEIRSSFSTKKSTKVIQQQGKYEKLNTNKTPKKTTDSASSDSGKSQMIALILCFFFGVIGIHRFYLGYPTAGIIQLLTLGGCGIWALIDLIRIISGNLKPKNGEYKDKF